MTMEPDMNYATFVPWMLTLVSLTVSAWQYTLTSKQKNLEPFLKAQLDFTLKATESMATLAVETDPAKWEEARRAFQKLYWGTLTVVESKELEAAMICVNKLIPPGKVEDIQLPVTTLQVPSYFLALTARNFLMDSWKIELPTLKGGKEGAQATNPCKS